MLRQVTRGRAKLNPLQLLAIPAGFEPATHGVEIRSGYNDIHNIGEPCTNGVPSGAEKPKFHAFRGALISLSIGELAIGIKRHLDRGVPHELLYLLRIMALLDPQRSARVA
jgi:hypothetical protein